MSSRERGGEAVQFMVAVSALLLIVFGAVQIGGMMLSTTRISSDVLRACKQLNAAGIECAADREEFVKSQILSNSGQLIESNLSIDHVACSSVQVDRGHVAEGQESISLRRERMAVSFDLSYEIPSFLDLPGLSGRMLERHVECVRTGSSLVEVEMAVL